MGSTSPMSRKNKKKQLKRQIVPPNNRHQEEEGSRETARKAHKRMVRKRLVIFLVLVILTAIAVLVLFRYDRYHQFTDYQVIREKNPTSEAQEAAVQGEGSFCTYRDYGDGVLKHTKDGASYIDARGKVVWIQSYKMKSPVVSINGEYAAIGGQQGNNIYICNKSGKVGQVTTLLPIPRVTVSAKGAVAVLQEDSKASYIYLYKKDGSTLDLSIKSLLSGGGYPVDMSLSPNGTQLVTSYMYLDQGIIKCRIASHNFGLGKNDPRRVVGIFFPQDFGDATAGRVRFLDESHVMIFTDEGTQFFSTRVETPLGSVKQIPIEGNIRSIAYMEEYVGLVTDNVESGDPYSLKIFDKEGNPVFDRAFNYQYTGFDIDGGPVLLYNDNSCKVFNMVGTEKYNGTFEFTVSKVLAGRFPETLLVMGPQMMTEIKLQQLVNGKDVCAMGMKRTGVDIGDTSVKIGLFEVTDELLDRWEVKTREEDGGPQILPDAVTSIREKMKEHGLDLKVDLAGVGTGVPGPVLPDGYVEICVSLGRHDLNFQGELSRLLDGIPVKSGNDVNVAVLGEMWQGGGKGYSDLVMPTPRIGVDGAVIIDQKIIAGKHGLGGEIGHIHVRDEEQEHCSCGGVGCAEQICSAIGIARGARRKMAANEKLSQLCGSGDSVIAKNVLDTAKEGDELVMGVMEVIGRYLGLALPMVAMTVDPEILVTGGGIFKAGQFLTDIVQKYYDHFTHISKHKGKLDLATLGNDVGVHGAARLIL